MGIESASFQVLCDVVREVERRPVRMLSLGYPDLLVREDVLRARLPNGDWFKPARARAEISRWHNWTGPLYDTDAVFKGLGIETLYADIYASRGIEKVIDLNRPLEDPALSDAFDVVFDGGTTEHCFNVGQVFRNIVAAVRTGGFVIHTNPMTQCNHGFWNLNPTTYIDFYQQNGFEVLLVEALTGHPMEAKRHNVRSVDRLKLPAEVRSLVVARKREDRGAAVWPTQSKYLKNRELKA